MRGKLFYLPKMNIYTGITPADAGKTAEILLADPSPQDHPRGCGENSATAFLAVLNTGSPPRMRGKRKKSQCWAIMSGITPADAGKTKRQGI